MSDQERKYCERFPWKAKECVGCRVQKKLKKNENFCNECREILKSLPNGLVDRVRRGEITSIQAKRMHDFFSGCHRTNRNEDGNQKWKRIESKDILNYIKNSDMVTSKSISDHFNMSEMTARNHLNYLFDEGMIKKEKYGKVVAWKST